MKFVTIVAAAALLVGVNAASAQTSSPGASKPGVTVKEVPATGTKAHRAKSTGIPAPRRSDTTGSSSDSEIRGVTPGSNPNPPWNRNPDPEVPGNTEE